MKNYPLAKRAEPNNESKLRFRCPTCKQILQAPPEGAGRRVRCPRCKTALFIPAAIIQEAPVPAYVSPPPAPVMVVPPRAEAPAPEPTVPMNIAIPGSGISVGTQVTQKTANGMAKTVLGGALVAAGVLLAAWLGVQPPRSS